MDRRATLIQLTDTAMPIIQKAGAAMGQAAEKVLENLPVGDRSKFMELLQSLHQQSKEAFCSNTEHKAPSNN